jgi:hypothetical protein
VTAERTAGDTAGGTAGHAADRTARRAGPGWLVLLRPRWLAWHAFAVLAFAGMLWLGDWQLHRAESGNELSWAYTFEWPLFAICGAYFWVKTVREELRGQEGSSGDPAGPAPAAEPPRLGHPADQYAERLKAEVRGHGKWHGWR